MPRPISEIEDQFAELRQASPSLTPSASYGWMDRIGAGAKAYKANLLGLGEAAGLDWADARRLAESEADTLRSRSSQALGAPERFSDVNGVGDFFKYAGGLAADSLPYAGEAIVGGLTGGAGLAGTAARMGLSRAAARTAGAVGASYPSAVGDILSNQRDQNPGAETNLGSALLGGGPYAAANAFGIEGALARGTAMKSGIQRLDDMTGWRGAAARTGASVGKGALQEAPAETFQEGVNQYFGRMAVDPNETFFNERSNDRFAESAVGGAVLGGLFGGGMGGWRRSQEWQDRQNAAAQRPLDPRAPRDLLQDADSNDLFGGDYSALPQQEGQSPFARGAVDSLTSRQRPSLFEELRGQSDALEGIMREAQATLQGMSKLSSGIEATNQSGAVLDANPDDLEYSREAESQALSRYYWAQENWSKLQEQLAPLERQYSAQQARQNPGQQEIPLGGLRKAQDLLDRPAFALDGGTGAPLAGDPSNQQDQVVWSQVRGPDGNPVMVPSYPGGYQAQRMDDGQRNLMSGVNNLVAGVPTELTNDELVSGRNPTWRQVPELFTQMNPLQPRIDANLGVNRTPYAGKNYEQQFEAAASEPTGQRVAEAANGQEERNVTALEASRRRAGITDSTTAPAPKDRNWAALGLPAKPTPALKAVYEAAVAARDAGEITPADFKVVKGLMGGGSTREAKSELRVAISHKQGEEDMAAGKAAREAQKALDATALQTQGQPNGALATPGVGAGGSRVAGGAVAQGSVADTGSNAAVGGRVSAAAPGVGVNGAAPAAGANGQAGQSTAVVADPASADYQETEGIWNDEVEKIQGPAFATLRPETQSYLIQQNSITPAVIQSAAKMEQATRQETAAAANEQDVDQSIAEARIDLPKVLKVLKTYTPKMQRAIQLAMGVDEYGNIVDNPISSEEAAKKAGYKDGANIRRTLKALNITQAGVNLLHNPSGAVALDNEARLMGENPNVGDINANVDAQKLGSATNNKFIAKLQQMGEAADPKRPYAAASHSDLAYAAAGVLRYLGPEKSGPNFEIANALFAEVSRRQNDKLYIEAYDRAMRAAIDDRSTTKASATDTLPAQVTEGEIDDDAGTTGQESDYANYDTDNTAELGSPADEAASGVRGEGAVSKAVSESSVAPRKSPTITVKTRRKFGVAAAEQSDGASQEAPISVTLNLNGGQTVFADAKKAIRQLDQKIERQKALLGCLRG